jgi:hypothetical protein
MKKIIFIFVFCASVSGAVFLNSFNSGQLSTKMKWRIDTEKRGMGVEELENLLIRPQGMTYRRPGTEYIADANSVENIVLIPFEYSNTDAYAMEFGHNYIAFFRTE